MNKKGNKIKFIFESSIIGGSLLISSLLGYRIHKLNELDKELTKEHYKKYAEALVEECTSNNVVYIYDGESYYSTLDKSGEVTTGEYLSKYLTEKDFKCAKVNDDFYTNDGRNIYVYVVNNHYVIFNEDEYEYLNGVSRFIDTYTYDDLKDYSVYLDVNKDDTFIEDGEIYYRTTRNLIRK